MKNNTWGKIPSSPNFVELEKNIAQFWKDSKIFEKTLCAKDDKPLAEYVFYDGPPFANGLPHYGHLLTSTAKDTIGRFQTMTGHYVRRVFGWDCHGLPAEMAAEKALGVSGRKAIEEFGIDKFNDVCKSDVMKYSSEWKYYIERIGRWVDMESAYKTMDVNFMESVLWAFKALYDKGLIYKEMRVAPYSWACQTPLSNFETRLDNSYRQKESKSLIVKFKLKSDNCDAQKQLLPMELRHSIINGMAYILVWTTTPWTLPSNVILAVSKDLEYEYIIDNAGNAFIAIGIEKFFGDLKISTDKVKEIKTIKGCDLIGLQYESLFQYFVNSLPSNSFAIYHGDFVTAGDGTGVVHVAPGFGEEDFELASSLGISPIAPIDDDGKFTNEVSDYAGMHVFDTNDEIIKKLKIQGNWVKTSQYLHNYPHCWRTDTPIIYRAMPSYYIRVSAFRDRLVELNQQINWIPSNVKDGIFGNWLKDARDWAISRNRFFGTPLPIWVSTDPKYPYEKAFGSIKELQEYFGPHYQKQYGLPLTITDLHRPFIDTLMAPNPADPTGCSQLKRVADVFDCWFESGSMPFAEVHYPFDQDTIANNDNGLVFDPVLNPPKRLPADFIVEYTAQTRGWFYTLMVLSTLIFDRIPFKNCICHGVILDPKGQKLSKRLGNYVDPIEVMDEYGADALRYVMLSSSVMSGGELLIDKEGKMLVEVIKCVHKPLWSALNFFMLYAHEDNPEVSLITLDMISNYDLQSKAGDGMEYDFFIILRAYEFSIDVYNALSEYKISDAYDKIRDFIDDLNNLYIRRSRDRFWGAQMDECKKRAYNSLYSALYIFSIGAAPIMPYLSEIIFQTLTQDQSRSVHLEKCLVTDDLKLQFTKIKKEYVEFLNGMNMLKKIFYSGRSLRDDKLAIRMRQPLSLSTIYTNLQCFDSFKDFFMQQIKDELNVKNVIFTESELTNSVFTRNLKLNSRLLGPRFGKDIIKIKNKVDFGEYIINKLSKKLIIDDISLEQGEYFMDVEINKTHENLASIAFNHSGDYIIISLDNKITQELMIEGMMRDIVRSIQDARKTILSIADRIELYIWSTHEIVGQACDSWKDYIMHETLASQFEYTIFSSDDKLGVEKFEENIVKNNMMICGYSVADSIKKSELALKLAFRKI